MWQRAESVAPLLLVAVVATPVLLGASPFRVPIEWTLGGLNAIAGCDSATPG